MANGQATSGVETWKPVVGYAGSYEVSDRGRVRSLARTVVYRRRGMVRTMRVGAKLLRLPRDPNGYPRVNIARYPHLVHALVMAAFIGPRPAGADVCHNDGDPSNNLLQNLRYDTRRGNLADAVKHGTAPRGERHGQSKFTEADVRSIRKRLSAG